ncbi:MAG: hypothetical protein Q4A84_03150 [Neisseria sp.]|uniref:hypothetical protein n=1 Tax=Neisseria sp. TaxID=192066 RepID=UPI0026DD744C|nr:hypothetical protein [Neisseria sp.]MDO4640687.1 hypothetical protein [Neisseria sp.]
MKKAILAAFLALAFGVSIAKPYPQHDVKQDVLGNKRFNLAAAERIMQDISEHARDYPTRFDNEADKKRAGADAVQLSNIYRALLRAGVVKPKDAAYPSTLRHIARLGWMAYNMDVNVPVTAQIADEHYRLLLSALPSKSEEQAKMQTEYGIFLDAIGQNGTAIKMLKQSLNNGNAAARKPLAMALIGHGKKEEIIALMRTYTKEFPQDKQAKDLLHALENGQIKLKVIP